MAEDKKEELQVLSGNMKKMGYISEIKSLISELTQYHISPEYLEDFCVRKESEIRGALMEKEARFPGHFPVKWKIFF